MTATTEAALFDGADHVTSVAEEYKTRLTAVKDRIDAYHADCMRRYATDEYHAAAARLRCAAGWLAGDYDVSYAGPHPSFGRRSRISASTTRTIPSAARCTTSCGPSTTRDCATVTRLTLRTRGAARRWLWSPTPKRMRGP